MCWSGISIWYVFSPFSVHTESLFSSVVYDCCGAEILLSEKSFYSFSISTAMLLRSHTRKTGEKKNVSRRFVFFSCRRSNFMCAVFGDVLHYLLTCIYLLGMHIRHIRLALFSSLINSWRRKKIVMSIYYFLSISFVCFVRLLCSVSACLPLIVGARCVHALQSSLSQPPPSPQICKYSQFDYFTGDVHVCEATKRQKL